MFSLNSDPINVKLIPKLLDILLITVVASNACEQSSGECCYNYYREMNSTCTECPTGTLGVNCSGKCPSGFHGKKCEEHCDCPSHLCHPVNGCVIDINNGTDDPILKKSQNEFHVKDCLDPCMYTADVKISTEDSSTDHFKVVVLTEDPLGKSGSSSIWQNISFALIGSLITIMVAAGFVLLSSRIKRYCGDPLRSTGNSYSGAVAIEGSQQPGSSASEVPLHRMDADEENRYDDLRSSKMIECHICDLPERNRSLTYIEENETGIINSNNDFRHLENSNKTNPENGIVNDEQENRYGNGAECFQYSVLSLRRNIDPSEMEACWGTQSLRPQYSNNYDDVHCLTNLYESDDNQNREECELHSDSSYTSKRSSNVSGGSSDSGKISKI